MLKNKADFYFVIIVALVINIIFLTKNLFPGKYQF